MIAGLGTTPRPAPTTAVLRLARELEAHGITADPHHGQKVAALSVAHGLVVWCEYGPAGLQFRWWTGRLSPRTGRWVYTRCPADVPQTAARRIAARHRELQAPTGKEPSHPAPPWPL